MHDLIPAAGDVSRWNVLGNQRTCANVGTSPDIDAAYDYRPPADKRAVFDDRRGLFGGWGIPRDSRVELAVDKFSSDPATSAYPRVVADVAFDDRIVAHARANADIGGGRHDNPRSDRSSGLNADVVLKFRVRADRYTLSDDGKVADPHPRPYDGVMLRADATTIKERTELIADDRGWSYLSSVVDRSRVMPDH